MALDRQSIARRDFPPARRGFAGSPLALLMLFPGAGLVCRTRYAFTTKHVRVTARHLVTDRTDDIPELEPAALLGHAGVKDNLEQQVAELVAKAL